eukprot:gene10682-11818_t
MSAKTSQYLYQFADSETPTKRAGIIQAKLPQESDETVRTGPEDSAMRKGRKLTRRCYISPGPNATWHVDGYDKLKPYGFPIHGCIDGFSRRILWFQLARSNNDPLVTASHYLKCVSNLQKCPELVQTDCGTENGILAQCNVPSG